jgi:integrase
VPQEVLSRPWLRLARKIASEVLQAPKTAGDPLTPGDWPDVHPRVVGYLERTIVGTPWADHLALAAAVLTARRCDVATVRYRIQEVHAGFQRLFPAMGLTTMADWHPEHHLRAYLTGEVLPHDRLGRRHTFWKSYSSATRHLARWLAALPETDRARYAAFVLPAVRAEQVEGLTQTAEVQRQQRQRRKAATDAVVPQFAAIRAEAHRRHNRLRRLCQAVQAALRELERPEPPSLPLAFSYEDGAVPEAGVPAQERLQFRLWDRRSFVGAHADRYAPETVGGARSRRRHPFAEGRNRPFVEFLGAERLGSDAPPQAFWFEELLRRGLFSNDSGHPLTAGRAATQAWLRAWGYGREESRQRTIPFHTAIPGLLSWSRKSGDAKFMQVAQTRTDGLLMPVDSLYAAATLGLLAVDLFTTTGMRISEAMQIRLTEDAFVRLVMPAPPGARDPSPRIRYAFRVIPKGERTDTPHTFFIGRETMRVLVTVATMLAEHYSLPPGAPPPTVAFDPFNARAHRFGPAPYLFQYAGRHLSAAAITACMRFLLHGLVFRTRDGQAVVLTAHLLRHAFATHAVQVEKIPVDIVGEWLKQKQLDVTEYYSQPTDTMIAEAADRFLARIAAHIHVGEAVRRSPPELQTLYEASRGKVGTLAEVIGGHCVSHGFCAAKFACVGCAGKVPDPAKRHQVERQRQWATAQVQLATAEGLYPEAERMKQLIRDCDTELQEMDQIEAYRRDEARDAAIHLAR